MATLVLHTPTWRTQSDSAKSFQQTIDSAMGEGYALAQRELDQLRTGCDVIIIDKGKKRRADAKLARLEATSIWTANHVQRYNVHLRDVVEVPYRDSASIRLNRRGSAVI